MTASIDLPTTPTPLFGGAIVANLPRNFVDASNFRPVPDSQEVYVSRTYDTDISIIVDILSWVAADTDEEAVKTHWEDIVGSAPARVVSQRKVQLRAFPGAVVWEVVGGVGGGGGYTAILVTVIRLREQGTDLVVSVNVPDGDEEMVRIGEAVRDVVVGSLTVVDWGLFVDE